MIFVDTGIWYADFVSDDPEHHTARRLLEDAREPLVTTDYVVGEILTLLRARGRNKRATEVADALLSGSVAQLIWAGEVDGQEVR